MCAWAAGTYTKGNASTGGWTGDASLGIGIEAGRHDTQDNDFATGINQCINKDGSNAFTGDANLGGFKPTNIAAGTAAAPAICVGGDVNTGVFGPAADTWAVATNGTERVRVDSSGNIQIPGAGNSVSRLKGFYNVSAPNETNLILSQNWNYVTNSADSTLNGTASISIEGGASNYSAIRFFTNANNLSPAERMRITNNGSIGINRAALANCILSIASRTTTNAEFAFYCENSAPTELIAIRNDGLWRTGTAAASPYNNTAAVSANVHVDAGGALYRATSSLKYKTDVQSMSYGLDKVLALRPVTYKGKAEVDGDKVYAGLIAEEVDAAGLPEFVQYAQDGSPDALNYGNMVALAFKAIQELNAKVEALQSRVEELEGA